MVKLVNNFGRAKMKFIEIEKRIKKKTKKKRIFRKNESNIFSGFRSSQFLIINFHCVADL